MSETNPIMCIKCLNVDSNKMQMYKPFVSTAKD